MTREARALVDAAVRPAERCAAAAARDERHPLPAARHLERRPARLGARLLHARGAAGADADRPRPGAPVPARLQQEPELRSSSSRAATPSAATRGSRSCRRRASLPRAIRLPPAIAEGEYAFVFLTSILHAHVGELFAGMNVKGCLPVPRDAQLRPVRRRGGNQEPAHRAAGRAAAAALRRRGAPRGRRGHLAAR